MWAVIVVHILGASQIGDQLGAYYLYTFDGAGIKNLIFGDPGRYRINPSIIKKL